MLQRYGVSRRWLVVKRRSARQGAQYSPLSTPAWPWTYCFSAESGAPPQLTMQYERLQNTGLRYTRRTCEANSLRIRRDETVLKLLTSTEGATFGLSESKRCT